MFFIPRNNKKHVSSVRDSHFVDFCAANYGQVYCTVHYILIFNELCAANYCRAYTIYCFIVKRWEMQLFFVKLRVRIDMFSIRFRIWYSYIQKRGNATPHVQELVASSVWVVAIYTCLRYVSVRFWSGTTGFAFSTGQRSTSAVWAWKQGMKTS